MSAVPPAGSFARLHRLRRWCWIWHRRLGLTAALLVLLACVTGILLNHTDALHLDEHKVRQSWLLNFYGIQPPPLHSLKLGGHWYSELGGEIFRDQQALATCRGQLLGGLDVDGMQVLACQSALVLLDSDGQLLEILDERHQLPVPLTGLGRCDGALCLRTAQGNVLADLDQLSWQATHLPGQWAALASPPPVLATALSAQAGGDSLSWERVVLDLHSGRIAGATGVLLMDAAAVLLMFLALSGFWLWWISPTRRARQH